MLVLSEMSLGMVGCIVFAAEVVRSLFRRASDLRILDWGQGGPPHVRGQKHQQARQRMKLSANSSSTGLSFGLEDFFWSSFT